MKIAQGTVPVAITLEHDGSAFRLMKAVKFKEKTYDIGSRVTVDGVFYGNDGTRVAGISIDDACVAIFALSKLDTAQAQRFGVRRPKNKTRPRIPYLAADTRIKTAKGEIPVSDIDIGDRVITRDHGLQTVRWVTRRVLPAKHDFAPLRLRAGVLGADQDLVVTPDQCVLISGVMSELFLGADETLVAAHMLENKQNVCRSADDFIQVAHIMFDQHEIIWANGCQCESFNLGDPDVAQTVHFCDKGTKNALLSIARNTAPARSACHPHEGRVIAAALL